MPPQAKTGRIDYFGPNCTIFFMFMELINCTLFLVGWPNSIFVYNSVTNLTFFPIKYVGPKGFGKGPERVGEGGVNGPFKIF